ncbi:MAG: rhombotarget, partial [Pseudomonadota bacterium]
MLKRMIGLSLLCVAGHAHSATLNLIVNTTADENGTNNSACSLREAVTLISSGKLGVVEENTTTKVITNGYGGCGVMKTAQITTTDDKGVTTTKLGVASDSDTYTAIIELENGQIYELNPTIGRLDVKQSMSIRAKTLDDVNDPQGLKAPIIRATGHHGIFRVNDEKTAANSVIAFAINQINLEGCNSSGTNTNVCESLGGVIINNESLTLSKVRIKGGYAVSGGAIYNASSDARLVTNDVEFSGNTATNGAAIYVEQSGISINRSLFQKNTATDSANFGAVIWMATQGKAFDTDVIARTNTIANSTFTNNTAYASNLVRDMRIVSSTIVGNRGGVYLDSTGLANLANSIVAGNTAADCHFSASNQAYINHVVYVTGCEQSAADHITGATKITNTGTTTLFADANNDQICDKPPANGLLCPLRAGKNDFLAFFKPRMLMSYTNRFQ